MLILGFSYLTSHMFLLVFNVYSLFSIQYSKYAIDDLIIFKNINFILFYTYKFTKKNILACTEYYPPAWKFQIDQMIQIVWYRTWIMEWIAARYLREDSSVWVKIRFESQVGNHGNEKDRMSNVNGINYISMILNLKWLMPTIND